MVEGIVYDDYCEDICEEVIMGEVCCVNVCCCVYIIF